jgi:DNA replication protein DnaC
MKDAATLPLLLRELKLPTMGRLWEEVYQKSQAQGWSSLRYFSTLCDYELADRESRRIARHMAQAQLPRGKSLETFDFSFTPRLNKTQILGLGNGDLWIKDGMNVLIFGPSGTGKTHLAAGIGEKLVQAGYRVLFTRTTELLQRLQAAKRDCSLPALLDKLDKYDCLILDDFGYVKKSEAETSLLFELISERYERRSLLITCNQVFKDWDQIFDDNRMAVAAVDRLVHHSTIVEVLGESYRKSYAERRQAHTNNKESS